MHRRDRRHTEKNGRESQNDIKKLRRENEQLRHEIWSLRDEYDKLEEILKCQKNRDDSEDYEDRSDTEEKNDDEEAEDCSDYSDEEAEEDCDEEKKALSPNYETQAGDETNHEERLENAENQKISSEKMSSSNHRLHVEFDDLSVVDEEEELKRDKERRDALSSVDTEGTKISRETDYVRKNTPKDYQCFSSGYGSPEASGSANSYYPERSLVYRNSDGTEFREILPNESSSMLLTQCPGLYDNSFSSNLPAVCDENLRRDRRTYGSQVGWRSNIFAPGINFQTSQSYEASAMAAQLLAMRAAATFDPPGQSNQSARSLNTARAASLTRGESSDDRIDYSIAGLVPDCANFASLSQPRNLHPGRTNNFNGETIIPGRAESSEIEASNSAGVLTRNGWDFDSARLYRDADDRKNTRQEHTERSEAGEIIVESEIRRRIQDSRVYNVDRRKHFFAPLPAKIQRARRDSGDRASTRTTINYVDSNSAAGFFESYGTEKSSGSDRTDSTVISTGHFQPQAQSLMPRSMEYLTDNGEKGSADICVNGVIATLAGVQLDRENNDERGYKSSDNLLIGETENSRDDGSSMHGSNNPLVKSVSCQDLNSEQLQNSLFEITRTFHGDGKCQKFAKSDNTLDNPIVASSKPFRSQLNVTLKFPRDKNSGLSGSSSSRKHERYSPEIPEIPKLPTIDYKFFNNPFLKTFDATGEIYENYDIRGQVTRPLAIQANESSPERDRIIQRYRPSNAYSSAALTQTFAKRSNPEADAVKSTRTCGTGREIENDGNRVSVSSAMCQVPSSNDPRIILNPGKQRRDFQATSFEAPNPRSLHADLAAYDIDSRRIVSSAPSTINPSISNHPTLYRNVPFVPGTAGIFCSDNRNAVRMFYESQTQKVPAQTQTSIIDGDTSHESDITVSIVKNLKNSDTENRSTPGSPTSTRRKRSVRKERVDRKIEKPPLSPAAQRRRLRKQSSIDSADPAVTEQSKIVDKIRHISSSITNTTTTTGSEHTEEKNESRSSSSGQESPRKERGGRVSTYFNGKKRTSVGNVRTGRSCSIGDARDNFGGGTVGNGGDIVETTNSEAARTNSASSREPASVRDRKSSVSSGKVPWCACWGNGCV